ncbi:MAG TPA: sigma-70 family RNA polymerase sigma factor [Nocardioides sp.]|uniref:sigma-70 family RNA polymerase sigma factor n=1 Tax=Nocardioides sp. TaxID=35761 RepID=UPI002B72136A|nr:sigma-70 family RNA polymerase sigma factor [Nocardioides sp.]HQR27035.1 sigma-70 family RNA polymerase sigma factor [Nocardioides sp.]
MPLDADLVVAELPGLLRYAMALTRDPDRAADLVQDTVARALERSDQYRGESAPATWLHRVMYHLFVDDVRRRAADPVEDEMLAGAVEAAWRDDAYTVDAEAVLLRAEVREELYDALVRLPVGYRSAVVLHDVEGLTAGQVAEVAQVSLPAAKQRIRRGRAMLVSALAGGVERREATRGVPMRCWQARSRIDDYLSGELAEADRTVLEQHLAACPTCPALYASIVGVTEALGSMRDPDTVVPPVLAARVRALTRGADAT